MPWVCILHMNVFYWVPCGFSLHVVISIVSVQLNDCIALCALSVYSSYECVVLGALWIQPSCGRFHCQCSAKLLYWTVCLECVFFIWVYCTQYWVHPSCGGPHSQGSDICIFSIALCALRVPSADIWVCSTIRVFLTCTISQSFIIPIPKI